MAQLVFFVLANVFAAAAMAQAMVQPEVGAPVLSPAKRIPPKARKLGAPSTPSPLSNHFDTNESQSSEATSIRSGAEATAAAAAAPEESRSGVEHRRPSDKSVTGGRVILGGLATTLLVAIFCYIRATRRLSKEAKAADQTPAAHHQLP